ncbi:MAG TPA: hypothetical protein VGM07_14430 [Stellaceae bacterium]
MTRTDTVLWLRKEMEAAVGLGRPLVGCFAWPNPAQADPAELRRALGEADVERAIGRAQRRGIALSFVAAAIDAAAAACSAGNAGSWIVDLIDTLDNLPTGIQPVKSARL